MEFMDLDNKNEDASKEILKELNEEDDKSPVKKGLFIQLERFLWFSGLIFYLEFVYHIWSFGSVSGYIFLKLLMSLMTGALITVFTSFFPRRVNKILSIVFSLVFMIFSVVDILYHAIFKVFFSIEFIEKTNTKVVQYYREIFEGIVSNWLVLTLSFVVPLVALILLSRFVFKYEKASIKTCYFSVGALALFIGLSFPIVPLFGNDSTDPINVLKNDFYLDAAMEEVGMFATHEVELRNIIIPRKETLEDFEAWVYEPENESKSVIEEVETENEDGSIETVAVERVIDTSPNILDIDFVSLAENEDDEMISNIHSYFSSVEPTYKNEYTGMFKGFNLILLTCEGFSPIAVDETHTPTLYRLTHEGFVFTNFYNPRTGGSTSDGEFVINTSLHPTNGGAKNFRTVGQNSMPFSLGQTFNRTYGITSRAYHDNDYEYYARDITYPGMGYYYTGVGNGLDVDKHWPASDLQMMEDSLPDFIDDEIFNVYYMTVSGHMNYNFEGNWCAKKHYDDVQDLPYSDTCKAYVACQMELDAALEYLIEELEEHGIADRTVICFTGDHWPYGLDEDWNTYPYYSELLGHQVETNFELYKSNLVLWSGAIKEPIVVDKPCCSIDILPTLLNLFGFDYDSRLLMGRDIFSDTEPFVAMFNRSIITDKLMYNSETKEVTYLTDEELPEDYLDNLKSTVNNRWKYSKRIIDYDYYSYIADYLNIEVSDPEQNYFVDYSKFTP